MIKRDQRGFTLIEILLAIAIAALITGAATVAMFQVINVTNSNNDHITAIQQVQNAGYWISHDTLMAQNVVTVNDPETSEHEFITLSWTNWETDEVRKIIYTFHNMPDGLRKQLKRQYLIYDAYGVEIGNETIVVAQYIDSEESFFEPEEDGVWKLTIQATIQARSGKETETREYEVNPRVNI